MDNLTITQTKVGSSVSTLVEYNGTRIGGIQAIKTHIFINDMGREEVKVTDLKVYNPDWFSSSGSDMLAEFIDAVRADGGSVTITDLEPKPQADVNWGSMLAICAGITGIISILARGTNKKQNSRVAHTSRK